MSQPKHALKRPTNTWTVAMSDTEANYVQQATDMSEDMFCHMLDMSEEGFTSPLFYDVMIEEMYKRRKQNKVANKATTLLHSHN